MRELSDDLSGPWSGWSVQFGIRISESLHLVIRNGLISGVGSDKDGDFEVQGSYHLRSGRVLLTRVYTWTTEPSQAGVGINYDYEGNWDGQIVSGGWQRRSGGDGGPFEMWPQKEGEGLEISKFVEELAASKPQ